MTDEQIMYGQTIDVTAVAAALWRAEAIGTGTPDSVIEARTPEAFAEQSPELQSRWLKFAMVAVAAIQGDQPALSEAARDVLAERARQISAEGWTPEWDDTYKNGEMAKAAGSYALASTYYHADPHAAVLTIWPWARSWLKPTNPRRDLVKAGALILAEIERLDRAASGGA